MVADIQTFLHAVALKLGVIIYTAATVRGLDLEALRAGRVELQRSSASDSSAAAGTDVGVVRWHYDTVTRVRSGVTIRFDAVLEATGGRSGARDLLVGADNVVPMRTVARDAALRDPSLDSYFDDPEDHATQIIESDYGCPPEVRREFSAALVADDGSIPDELPSIVSNIDASIIVKELEEVPRPAGMGARIGERGTRHPARLGHRQVPAVRPDADALPDRGPTAAGIRVRRAERSHPRHAVDAEPGQLPPARPVRDRHPVQCNRPPPARRLLHAGERAGDSERRRRDVRRRLSRAPPRRARADVVWTRSRVRHRPVRDHR